MTAKPLDTSTLGPISMASTTPLNLAKERVRAIARGGTINGTYRMSPESALAAFRADLLRILAA